MSGFKPVRGYLLWLAGYLIIDYTTVCGFTIIWYKPLAAAWGGSSVRIWIKIGSNESFVSMTNHMLL